jgi:hypothetical protein
MPTIEEIRDVLQEEREQLMNRTNVVATGIGYKRTDNRMTDKLCIVCSVGIKMSIEKLDEEERIPEEIEGVQTDVNPTGMFRMLEERKPTEKFRPAPGGVSVGHFNITAGTFGCLVQKDGDLFMLSNNHVLANSNEAELEDAILQPGPTDGGMETEDTIATLSEFVPITYESDDEEIPANLVDAAIAKPVNTDDIEDNIFQIGMIEGVKEADFDMEVQKSGRTTGITSGVIEQIDVTSRVNYGPGRVAVFSDQVMAGSMSQGGDSGSAVLDNDNNIVGLLFAGSDTSTLINRIENVFDALEVTLPGEE